MVSSKLFHDQQIAAGEHVRIWQSDQGSLFEHVFPTGNSITVQCQSLDDAVVLMTQYVQDVDWLVEHELTESLYKGDGHEAL